MIKLLLGLIAVSPMMYLGIKTVMQEKTAEKEFNKRRDMVDFRELDFFEWKFNHEGKQVKVEVVKQLREWVKNNCTTLTNREINKHVNNIVSELLNDLP